MYNNGYHSNAMMALRPPNPTLMILFRDNFSPCFVVSDDTRYPFVLYGLFLREGNAFLRNAHVLGWNGSYLVVRVVCGVRKSAVVVLEVLLRCAGRDTMNLEWIKCKKTKIVISNVTKYYFKNPSESFDETASRWRICHRRRSCFA